MVMERRFQLYHTYAKHEHTFDTYDMISTGTEEIDAGELKI